MVSGHCVFRVVAVIVGSFLIISSFSISGFAESSIDNRESETVFINECELSYSDWVNYGNLSVERSGIFFSITSKFWGGYSFHAIERGGKDVFVSVDIPYTFIEPLSIGSFVSDNGMFISWYLGDNSFYVNFTLRAHVDEWFSLSSVQVFKYKMDYGYRDKVRSLVYGQSVSFSVMCDEQSPTVLINISKNFRYGGRNISVSGSGVVVKYRVDTWVGTFKYPINTNREHPVWYEVRDINECSLQIVVHFDCGKSGDLYIVLNSVWYDYISIVPILDVFGCTEPSGSLSR